MGTHAKHATHAEALDLLETPKGLLDQTLDERVERPIEERRSRLADLGVHADEVHQSLKHVRSYLCTSRSD
jgi:hypothetical protein